MSWVEGLFIWKSWSPPRKHVAHTIDGMMSCLFTAGEEPLGTGGVQGWGEAKRCWGFPLISKGGGGRLLRARQRYLASLMRTAVLGSVNPCRVSALGTVQRVGGPTLALYIQWVEPCLLFYPRPPHSSWWCHLSPHAPHHAALHSPRLG